MDFELDLVLFGFWNNLDLLTFYMLLLNMIIIGRSISISIVLAICFLLVFLFFQIQINRPLSQQGIGEEIFKISKGDSVMAVAKSLKKEGFIQNELYFIFYIFSQGASSNVQAGDYILNPGMSVKEISDKFLEGSTLQITVTIPEGWGMREIEKEVGEKLQSNIIINNQKVTDYKEKFDFLKDAPDDAGLEGFLFPDTYKFASGSTSEDFIESALYNFGRKLTTDLRLEIQKQEKSIFETVTMASLIQKEVTDEEDMRLVSGILWKRLEIGMPLQVDATIIYLTCAELVECADKKSSQVLLEDLKIDSLYNTYLYLGLPPGPIANPGIQAIKAAVLPENSDYLYYLSAPDGTTFFSKTLEEHNRNKFKYLK